MSDQVASGFTHAPSHETSRAMTEPIVDWIGDVPISHGERDDGSGVCLCGHPDYLTCPDWPMYGIANFVIHAASSEVDRG